MSRTAAIRKAIIVALAVVCVLALLALSGNLPGLDGDPVKSNNGANRGNSKSVPDDDGKGADKGLPGPDKPPSGDGNNGCGNDADFEDDNNGNCYGRIRRAYG